MTSTATRAEVLAALEDTNPDNPLARAVAAAIDDYSMRLGEQVARHGAWPKSITLPAPMSAVEAVALELFTQQMRGQGLSVLVAS